MGMRDLLLAHTNEVIMDSCEFREEVLPVLPKQDATPETLPLSASAPQQTAAASGKPASARRMPPNSVAPPCFFAGVCRQRAAIEKAGRSVCRECAGTRLRGSEYPLRDAASEPL